MIDEVQWVMMGADVKGDIYEGLLEKNAEDTKSKARNPGWPSNVTIASRSERAKGRNPSKPLLLLASPTGFAPVLSP